MYGVEVVRTSAQSLFGRGLSRREAARRFVIDRRTVAKMLEY